MVADSDVLAPHYGARNTGPAVLDNLQVDCWGTVQSASAHSSPRAQIVVFASYLQIDPDNTNQKVWRMNRSRKES